jgi:hypothetical protein
VTHTGSGSFLQGAVTGFADSMADRVALSLSSARGIDLARLWTVNGTVDIAAGELWSRSTRVGQQLTITSPAARLLVYEPGPGPQPGYDAQLYPGGADFMLNLRGNYAFTDAAVIYRNPMLEVITPDAHNSSASELGADELARIGWIRTEPDAPKPRAAKLVTFTGIPVSLEGDDADGERAPNRCAPDSTDPACVELQQ